MSSTQIQRRGGGRGNGKGRGREEEQQNQPVPVAGRVPPHDLDAEAAVLSAMMLEKDAVDKTLDILQPKHFYSDANRRIYQAITALAAVGTPVDPTTVASWLRSREWINQIGGASYLAQLVDATPAVANVAAHAKFVHEKWRVRELIGTCQRIAAEGYGDVGDVGEFVDQAEASIYELARDRRTETTVQPIVSVIKTVFEQIQAQAERGQQMSGYPSGYDAYDAKTAGIHDGDLRIVAARPGMGKAQPLDAKILTPTGWRRMGDLVVGDQVIGSDGRPCRVTGVYEQGVKPTWRITLHGYSWDGTGFQERSTTCCDEHLWTGVIGGGTQVALLETRDVRALINGQRPVRLPVFHERVGKVWHHVKAIEQVGNVECRCIMVDAPDHLYVTDDFIITHNTSLVMNEAVNVASPRSEKVQLPTGEFDDVLSPGLGAVVFSLEMPREQLVLRLLCSEARVDLNRIRHGQLQPEDWKNLTDAATYLSTLPIWIDDTPAISLLELRSKVRRLQAEYDRKAGDGKPARRIGVVYIDYLQLMKGRDGAGSREQEVSEISRGLKQLAKECKVNVTALSQLNRSVETRGKGGKAARPQLSDLRESGAIEQDADVIVFIYRDEYYNAETKLKGIAEIIIAKQRQGSTGSVFLRFTGKCTRFDNLAPGEMQFDEDSNQ